MLVRNFTTWQDSINFCALAGMRTECYFFLFDKCPEKTKAHFLFTGVSQKEKSRHWHQPVGPPRPVLPRQGTACRSSPASRSRPCELQRVRMNSINRCLRIKVIDPEILKVNFWFCIKCKQKVRWQYPSI